MIRPAEAARVVPEFVQRHLDVLVHELKAALGDDLVCVLLYGSLVTGGYRPMDSDVEVLVVLEEARLADLEAMAEALQKARYGARIEAAIVTRSEIESADRAFPLQYDEIKRHHVVLFGQDPFGVREAHDAHRRLRIEQILRRALVRLRRSVTDALGAPEATGGAVLRSVAHIRRALHAFLALVGTPSDGDLPSILATLAVRYSIDVSPLLDPREAPDLAHAAFVTLLTKILDELEASRLVSS